MGITCLGRVCLYAFQMDTYQRDEMTERARCPTAKQARGANQLKCPGGNLPRRLDDRAGQMSHCQAGKGSQTVEIGLRL